jgi:hypothetical protein
MDEATAGIAEYLKRYLDENLNGKVLMQIIESQARASGNGYSEKSAGFVLNKVLSHFTDKDMKLYSHRIAFDSNDINPDDDVKTVLLDDWSISGTQMRQLYNNLSSFGKGDSSNITKDAEILCVVATDSQIADGLYMGGGSQEYSNKGVLSYGHPNSWY